MFHSKTATAHNEQMKHIALSLNALGFSIFASGVLGPDSPLDKIVTSFFAWFVLFAIAVYILATRIIDLDVEDEDDAS